MSDPEDWQNQTRVQSMRTMFQPTTGLQLARLLSREQLRAIQSYRRPRNSEQEYHQGPQLQTTRHCQCGLVDSPLQT